MKVTRQIQILTLLIILSVVLIAIGISAHNTTNQQPQKQNYNWCPNTPDCPQPYCDNYQQPVRNCQPRSCCGWRN
jgi:hypothetical protein